tara:strand:- start:4021 stop:6207 length:2187 start_codon:yes stop_codon:yes gene_type:complete
MNKYYIFIIFSSIVFIAQPQAPANAQTQQRAEGAEASSELVEEMSEQAKKIDIEVRPVTSIEIPEHEAASFEMNFDKVPEIDPELTQNVTVDAYTRYVDVDGQRIAQLVLSGVRKGERAEALTTENFYSQFQIKDPALDNTKEVIVEGDHAELLAALTRLVVDDEEGDQTTNTADSNEHQNVGGDENTKRTENVGNNNGGNEDAAAYTTPDPIIPSDETEEEDPYTFTVDVLTDGCPIRVDIGQLTAFQQSKVITNDNGQITETPCEDSNARYPLERSYASCPDRVDLDARLATAQYQLYYTGPGGERITAQDCADDPDKTYEIVEQHDGCAVYLDYASFQAVPLATLAYLNDVNATVEVRGCETSESKSAVPLVPTTDGCTIRHAFNEDLSYQQGRYQYTLEGVTWDAGSCIDNGTTYSHVPTFTDEGGRRVCEPIVNESSQRVTQQYRLRITVDDVDTYITECRPATGNLAIQSTTDGCTDPATWDHDISAGVSYNKIREYYMRNGAREYINECITGTQTYSHNLELAGWLIDDGSLTAQRLHKISINTPSGQYIISESELLSGASAEPYVRDRVKQELTGDSTYEGCAAIRATRNIAVYNRPDTSEYLKDEGVGTPIREGNICQETSGGSRSYTVGYERTCSDVFSNDSSTATIYTYDLVRVASKIITTNGETSAVVSVDYSWVGAANRSGGSSISLADTHCGSLYPQHQPGVYLSGGFSTPPAW